jgi:hypothetical protein
MNETKKLALVGRQEGKTSDGDAVIPSKGALLEDQPAFAYETRPNDNLSLTQQGENADQDATIAIRRDLVLPFVDRLAPACDSGIAS